MNTYQDIERAIQFASEAFGKKQYDKPVLLHSIRCGLYLFENGFGTDCVIAGILHDVVEDTSKTFDDIEATFNTTIRNLVAANTKDASIINADERRKELTERCCSAGQDAIAIKLSDIYDNFQYYHAIKDSKGVAYCQQMKELMMSTMQQRYKNTSVVILLQQLSRMHS